MGYLPIMVGEFPHSEICGWTDICSCPQLIAACHVLRRLLVPRHSPYALFHLTKSDFACFCVETGLQIYYLLINSRKLFFWFSRLKSYLIPNLLSLQKNLLSFKFYCRVISLIVIQHNLDFVVDLFLHISIFSFQGTTYFFTACRLDV